MPRVLQPCGTPAAYKRHVKRREPTCEPCREAHNRQTIEERNRSSASGRLLKPCGTPAAFQRHVARGEPIDEACRKAHNKASAARQRQARATKKALDQARLKENVVRQRARSEAVRELIKAHPGHYSQLYKLAMMRHLGEEDL